MCCRMRETNEKKRKIETDIEMVKRFVHIFIIIVF